MTSQLESTLEAFLFEKVRAAGGLAIKMIPVRKGIPDRLIMFPGGRMYLVELKTDTGRTSPMQDHFRARAAMMGTTVYVLHGRGEIMTWVRDRVAEEDPPARGGRGRTPRQLCPACGRDIAVKADGTLRAHRCEESA